MAMLYNQRVFQADGCIQTFRRDLGTREPCLVAARHREKATGSIAETNFSIYCSSKQPPNMFFFSQTMTYYDIFISFSHPIWWFKKNLKQRFFPSKNCHSLLRKFTVGGPIAAQVLANWCAHKGYPRLKDEEEVRRRRKLARRGRFGKLRNNESWHGKRSSPESENLEMYSFIMF